MEKQNNCYKDEEDVCLCCLPHNADYDKLQELMEDMVKEDNDVEFEESKESIRITLPF